MCPRCHGKGGFKAYAHILGGVCFKCWGSGDDKHPLPRPVQVGRSLPPMIQKLKQAGDSFRAKHEKDEA